MAKIKRQFTRHSQGLFLVLDDAAVCFVCFWSDNVILTRGLGRRVEWTENDWHKDVEDSDVDGCNCESIVVTIVT